MISLVGGGGKTHIVPLHVEYSLKSTFSCRAIVFNIIQDSIHRAVKVRTT